MLITLWLRPLLDSEIGEYDAASVKPNGAKWWAAGASLAADGGVVGDTALARGVIRRRLLQVANPIINEQVTGTV